MKKGDEIVGDMEIKVFIGCKDRTLRKRLKAILLSRGHLIMGEAEDGSDALRIVRRLLPDLAILDFDLPGISGLELAKIIGADKIAPVILLASAWEEKMYDETGKTGVSSFLIKPIQEGHLLATVSFVLQTFQRVSALEHQVDELKETIESRKLVQRATGILMKRLGLSEEEAYGRLRRASMDQCLPIKKIAQSLILKYEGAKK